ncbi:uncharacterized protein LOC142575292 isoform X2 [Dermacentor variabilis]|uniref:uncharacterized protein LOC142575292 isoform X2 n=1 Tax=Dermacentor variabilis TaxID=34621 RepID=UPI003F5C39E3
MPRKRKMPKQTGLPKEHALIDLKEEQLDKPKAHLRDIKNLVMDKKELFGSNIFARDVLLTMENKLQQSACNRTGAPISTSKANVPEQCPDDDDCVVLSQGSTTSRCSPRKRSRRTAKSAIADDKIVSPSEETQQILKKLEMLENIVCEDISLSDDSSDSLVCLDECPSLPAGEEDDDLILMVQCQSRMLKYSIAPHAPFAEILEKLAQECSVATSQVMLIAKEQPVQPEDTPQSLALSAADILDCIIRKYREPSSKAAKNMITLKFQCANKRSTESIETALDEPLQVGARVFAEKLKLRLKFFRAVYHGCVGIENAKYLLAPHYILDRVDQCSRYGKSRMQD